MIENFVENLEIGVILMLIGMGVVFSFLYILVLAMRVMSKFVIYLNKFFPEAVPVVEKAGKRSNVAEEEAIAVAIAVAKARG
ncbi:oxaloacetate decarboxylase gamma chain [Brachyspira sp. CAG:484]|nr:oxaloacetate decarboxylase gamma chain [Brachyspira sp. CAG:484]